LDIFQENDVGSINLISKKNILLHPHALRHSFATHHLSAGSSLAEIKTMLGHQNFNTTLIYAETEELRHRVCCHGFVEMV
jgi:site-specific recombinase XerD